jgi:drug/metabolite transporter (DMT)-like permease
VPEQADHSSSTWLIFALLTVVNWGLYGVLLHTGQSSMGDPVNGRYKAFLWVGIAYFLIAVLAPAGMLLANQASWAMPIKGQLWSLAAGGVGAIGAFCVLLAFGAKGHPAVVMSIIFAGAPIVNAFVAMAIHPPAGGLSAVRLPFVAGILLAAVGGLLVTLYRPGMAPPAKAAPVAAEAPTADSPDR